LEFEPTLGTESRCMSAHKVFGTSQTSLHLINTQLQLGVRRPCLCSTVSTVFILEIQLCGHIA
jgi:hypothetical protein